SETQLRLTEAYMKAMGLWHDENSPEASYSDVLTLDLGSVVPSLAGPKRPQDRISLTESKASFSKTLEEFQNQRAQLIQTTRSSGETEPATGTVPVSYRGEDFTLKHGSVVIAAITSCTNTSNPAVLMADRKSTRLNSSHVKISYAVFCLKIK